MPLPQWLLLLLRVLNSALRQTLALTLIKVLSIALKITEMRLNKF